MGFIDFGLIFILVYSSYKLWKISYKKSKGKLLLRVISIFILAHLVIFPLIYTSLINNNPKSIEIHSTIINNEKNKKLKEFNRDNNFDFQYEKNLINKILSRNDSVLKISYINDFEDQNLLFLNSTIVYCHWEFTPPGHVYNKKIIIYDKLGNKLYDFNDSYYKNESFKDALKSHIEGLTSKEKEKIQKLSIIKSNAFWSYRRILPYTLNILFNSNFNAISANAQIVYYIHNFLVLGFLLSFITSLLQNSLIKNSEE